MREVGELGDHSEPASASCFHFLARAARYLRVAVGLKNRSPSSRSDVLIVPRSHRADIWDISTEEAAPVIAAAQLVAYVLRSDLGAKGINIRQNNGVRAGQHVFHFHLHVVPRYANDTLLPGGVWGTSPWEPPRGGDAERRRVAETVRRGIKTRTT